ncbi:uncharacterized protein LOC122077366 isoform X3 [Macadamia integrifolia]|uniref:uncharacterized protein LOC122077366 isoform X3 n=1 Tax=Macadamia integrifolia TaxID=60698 RepID=UPI001C4F5874|nr:uncharacterized protein LOC122077366 isoform X3 [Macadamia integrifolia]
MDTRTKKEPGIPHLRHCHQQRIPTPSFVVRGSANISSPMAFYSMLIFVLIYLFAGSASSELVLEEGYTVSTVLDGNKLQINPYSVLPRPGTNDLVVLDHSGNIFYTVSFPISQESEINRFAGNGTEGFSDGESKAAMFKHPRSLTVDTMGNVYVADRNSHSIRKINKSGVTTIAGGYSKGPGKVDGPAQNASFSDDFELTFVPERCALLISDRGNHLVRQINLKPEDCGKGSKLDLGVAAIWLVAGLGALGILVLVSYLLISRTGRLRTRLFQRDMEALPNHSGDTSSDNLLRHQKRNC